MIQKLLRLAKGIMGVSLLGGREAAVDVKRKRRSRRRVCCRGAQRTGGLEEPRRRLTVVTEHEYTPHTEKQRRFNSSERRLVANALRRAEKASGSFTLKTPERAAGHTKLQPCMLVVS